MTRVHQAGLVAQQSTGLATWLRHIFNGLGELEENGRGFNLDLIQCLFLLLVMLLVTGHGDHLGYLVGGKF